MTTIAAASRPKFFSYAKVMETWNPYTSRATGEPTETGLSVQTARRLVHRPPVPDPKRPPPARHHLAAQRIASRTRTT